MTHPNLLSDLARLHAADLLADADRARTRRRFRRRRSARAPVFDGGRVTPLRRPVAMTATTSSSSFSSKAA